MRIAFFGDIHGNSIALDAVLGDIDANGGVDSYVVLGDLCAIGADPVGVLERIDALPNTSCVRGNTDRYLVSGERPPPPPDDEQLRLMIAGFNWTKDRLKEAGLLDRLAALPLEHEIELPSGIQVLAVHASPGKDDGRGFSPNRTPEECRELLIGCEHDIVFVGHTHRLFDRRIDGVHVINPGSVSNPPPRETRARHAILETDHDGGCILSTLAASYDRDEAVKALYASGFPAPDYVASMIGSRRE